MGKINIASKMKSRDQRISMFVLSPMRISSSKARPVHFQRCICAIRNENKSNEKRPFFGDAPSTESPQRHSSSKRAVLVAAALAAGIMLAPHYANALSEAQKLVAEAWRVVDQAYVDKTYNGHDWFGERQRAVKRAYASTDEGYEAIRRLLGLLDDPYTRLLTPAQYDAISASATGELAGGVGLEFLPTQVDGATRIAHSPENDTPAGRAALARTGDALVAVDGEDVSELSPDEVAARVRGRPGTDVTLTLQRAGRAEDKVVTLRREALRLRSVVAERRGAVGLVRVRGFNTRTAADVRDALQELRDAKALVLDLRNNPGGYFAGGVDAARLFLHSGETIVYTVDRNGIADEIDAIEDGAATETPLFVVVNGNTASASEILAGALKDNARATLVGEKTFGKGVVQTVSPLSDGAAVAVTVARYETPNHININKKGIAPNFETSCREDVDILTCLPPDALRSI